MEIKITELRLGFGSVSHSRMYSEYPDYSTQIKLFHFVIMLRFWCFLQFYCQSRHVGENYFLANGKPSKHYMTSKG